MRDRVCYFSKYDFSVGHNLEIAEKRIRTVSEGAVPSDLTGIIELWHVKRMMDEGCRLLSWTDAEYEQLKSSTSGYNEIIAKFFHGLNPETIKNEFDSLNRRYQETFWEIIEADRLYKLISKETLKEIVSSSDGHLRDVLAHKGLVEHFKTILHDVLMQNNSAPVILDKYVARRDNTDEEIYLPSNLTLADKEQIIVNYLQSENPNLNYVRLVTQVKDDKSKIVLSSRTKLLAEQLAQKLNDDLMNDPRTVKTHWSFGVRYVDDEDAPPFDVSIDQNGALTHTYSIPFIRKCDNLRRVVNSVSLFGWLNNHFLINLISKQVEISEMESLFMDSGRDAYPSSIKFHNKNGLAFQQLFAYNVVLKELGSSFENDLKQYYEVHLREEYDYPAMPINFPMEEDSALNKCRVLCPELDAIVKQYNVFVEEDEINKDLIRLSKPLKVEEGKSLLTNKYYETAEDNEDIRNVLRILFGHGNSLLHYVHPFKDKRYHSLIELLENEDNVLYANYEDYQKPYLDNLIQQVIIGVDTDGRVFIENKTKVDVLRSLWEYGVCSYWHYNDEGRQILDEMLNKGWLVTDDHLLSKPEQDYFSYYLDNMKFTNGMAYRNNYAHGSTPPVDDENAHINAYYAFLKLLALLLLKIEDDLFLARRALAIYELKKTTAITND